MNDPVLTHAQLAAINKRLPAEVSRPVPFILKRLLDETKSDDDIIREFITMYPRPMIFSDEMISYVRGLIPGDAGHFRKRFHHIMKCLFTYPGRAHRNAIHAGIDDPAVKKYLPSQKDAHHPYVGHFHKKGVWQKRNKRR